MNPLLKAYAFQSQKGRVSSGHLTTMMTAILSNYIYITFLADFFEVGMETGLLLIVSSDVSFSTTLLLPAATLPIPGCSTGG